MVKEEEKEDNEEEDIDLLLDNIDDLEVHLKENDNN